jgi:hypothetical protein
MTCGAEREITQLCSVQPRYNPNHLLPTQRPVSRGAKLATRLEGRDTFGAVVEA